MRRHFIEANRLPVISYSYIGYNTINNFNYNQFFFNSIQAYNKCCIKVDDVSNENSDLYLTPKKVKIQEFKFVLRGKDVEQKLEVGTTD